MAQERPPKELLKKAESKGGKKESEPDRLPANMRRCVTKLVIGRESLKSRDASQSVSQLFHGPAPPPPRRALFKSETVNNTRGQVEISARTLGIRI